MALALPAFTHSRLWGLLLVSIKPPPASWTQAIGDVADLFMNARVCFFTSEEPGSDYDPLGGGSGGPTVKLIWAGAARVQHLRSPRVFTTNYQPNSSRGFRFQLNKNAPVPFLPEGTRARVLSAGVQDSQMEPGDPKLELLTFVVDGAINASHQAVQTVELTANMRPTEWSWSVDASGAVTRP